MTADYATAAKVEGAGLYPDNGDGARAVRAEERPAADAWCSRAPSAGATGSGEAEATERLQLQKENAGLRRLVVELLETNQRLRQQMQAGGTVQ